MSLCAERDTMIELAKKIAVSKGFWLSSRSSSFNRVLLVCSKSGTYREKKDIKTGIRRSTVKENCSFAITLVRNSDEGWVCNRTSGFHNHELLTEEEMTSNVGARIAYVQQHHDWFVEAALSHIKPARILLAAVRRDPQCPLSIKDIYNFLHKLKFHSGAAQTPLLSLFQLLKEQDWIVRAKFFGTSLSHLLFTKTQLRELTLQQPQR
ncbi:hypothetical protein RCL1_003127 [Eukaryota sp. TZLM3-RCL]